MTDSCPPGASGAGFAPRGKDPARLPNTIGYYAAFITLGLASASLGPTLPGLAEQTRSHLAEISSLFVARSLGYLTGSLVGGRLYDRIAGHPVMAAGILLMAGMLTLAPLVSWLWVLVAAILTLGLAEGTLDVGGNTLLVWIHRERVAPFMNGLHFFFGVGAFLSPVIIAQVMLRGGTILHAYWALAVLLVPGALWLLILSSPVVPARTGDGSAGRPNHRLVALVVLFFFLYTGAEVAFGGWIFSYAVALGLGSDAAAAYLTSAFWGAVTLGRLLAIPLAVRFPPRLVLLADFVGCLAALGVLILGSDSPIATWVGTCGVGVCMASIFPAALSLAQERMPITGRVTGWFFVGASGGGMFLPWFIGQCFEPFGARATMVILFTDMAAALAVLIVLTLQAARPVYRWITGNR